LSCYLCYNDYINDITIEVVMSEENASYKLGLQLGWEKAVNFDPDFSYRASLVMALASSGLAEVIENEHPEVAETRAKSFSDGYGEGYLNAIDYAELMSLGLR
jgi:hypothetical protein